MASLVAIDAKGNYTVHCIIELVGDRSPHCLANRLRALDMVGNRFSSFLPRPTMIIGQAGNNHVYKAVE